MRSSHFDKPIWAMAQIGSPDKNSLHDFAWDLCEYISGLPIKLQIKKNVLGKPCLDPQIGHISISHHFHQDLNFGVVAAAISPTPVGVDVMSVAPYSIERKILIANLLGLNSRSTDVESWSDRLCTELWCRIESNTKCTGEGLISRLYKPNTDKEELLNSFPSRIYVEDFNTTTIVTSITGMNIPCSDPLWVDL